jgi:hypothetical protein
MGMHGIVVSIQRSARASAVAASGIGLIRIYCQERGRARRRGSRIFELDAAFTRRKDIGSRVYARACREREDNIVGMICLETIGCYSEEVGSQWLSLGGLFLPRRGNFLALVANLFSKALLTQVSETLRRETSLRIRPVTLPSHVPGAWSSDHWSFWREGFPAVMATDTAPLRYRDYHTREDTPDKVDFKWLNHVVDSLKPVVADLSVPSLEQGS